MYSNIFGSFIYRLINPGNCNSFLDLGCGRGQDLKYFKDEMNCINGSRFVGIDKLEKSILLAKNAYQNEGIEFYHMDVAQGLGFDDESFDIVYSMNAVECIADKPRLASEIYRVLKEKGQVIFCHCDWDSVVYNGYDKNLISDILKKYSGWQQPWMDEADSWMGRRLWGMFNSTGLFNGEIHIFNHIETDFKENSLGWNMIREFSYMVEAGIISKDDYDRFCNDIAETAEKGEYLYVRPIYIYKGLKD